MVKPNAKAYIAKLDEADVVQVIMSDPHQVDAIRSYVDDLRMKFADVSDTDLGWISLWFSEFIMSAYSQHGENTTPQAMMITFAIMSRELLLLEAETGTTEDTP